MESHRQFSYSYYSHKAACALFILFFFFSCLSFAQQTDTTSSSDNRFWDKVYFGGGLGAQFGGYTYVNLSPLIGYRFTEKLTAGAGITYMYISDRTYGYSNSIYGGRVFGRYYFIENLFAHGEYEVLNGNWDFYEPDRRFNVTSLLVGGGYSYRIGRNAAFQIMILLNLNETPYSPYSNPIFRGGFTIGL